MFLNILILNYTNYYLYILISILLLSACGGGGGGTISEANQNTAPDFTGVIDYAVDENSLLANAFGGQTTPHAFLFDGDMNLAYKGAIDDSYKSADEVKEAYLKEGGYQTMNYFE